jgi:hypothetical protein
MASFLRRLFASPQPAPPAEVALPGDGTFPLAIVGESKYQESLEAVSGGRSEDGADEIVSARLILEDSNPYDRNAVRVEIGGRLVGYLSRQDAKAYREYLQKAGTPRAVGVCEGHIRGGWKREGGDQGHFGVWLDFTLCG